MCLRHSSVLHEIGGHQGGTSRHPVVAMNEDALRGRALGYERDRGLELGQEVGLRHVRNGDLHHSLKQEVRPILVRGLRQDLLLILC